MTAPSFVTEVDEKIMSTERIHPHSDNLKDLKNRTFLTPDENGLLHLSVFGKPVVIGTEQETGNVAGKLWSVSLVLLNYFQKMGVNAFAEKRVLELGAGVGLLGIALSRAGAKVTCTDLHLVLPLLQSNVTRNQEENVENTGTCKVTALAWGLDEFRESTVGKEIEQEGDYDYIIAADLVYDECLHDILVETLQQTMGPNTVLYLIYIDRLNFDIMINVRLCEAEDPTGEGRKFRIEMVQEEDFLSLGVEGIHFYKVTYN
eukprot:CFRG0603T1